MDRSISCLTSGLIAAIIWVAIATAAQGRQPGQQTQALCQPTEQPPATAESNPTVRDATIQRSNRSVTAQACIVLDPNQLLRPGGNYIVPSAGLFYDWNLALVGVHGRLIDTFGTIDQTGPVRPGDSPLGTAMDAAWDLVNGQPDPLTDYLLAQVSVAACKDTAQPHCSFDPTQQFYVTRLLRRPRNPANSEPAEVANAKRGCLARPMRPGRQFELRQLTVVGPSQTYHVFACVVSNDFASFKSVGFNVRLMAADGTPVATSQDGNTRINVGPVTPSEPSLPRVVALLAVDIAALASPAAKVAFADTTISLTGCAQPDATGCGAEQTETWRKHPVAFYPVGR